MLNPSVPLFRLEDTGMGEQLQEYAVSPDHWFRRFDDYRIQQIVRIGNRCLNIIGKILPLAFWAKAHWAVKLLQSLQTWLRCVAEVEPVRGLACKALPDGNCLHF